MAKEVNGSDIPKHDPKHLRRPIQSFLHSDVKHFKYKCTSLKACENLTQRLRLTHHTEVTDELWRDIRGIQGDVDLVETDQSRRNAYRCAIEDSLLFLVCNPHNMISCSIARSDRKLILSGKGCQDHNASCRPVFRRFTEPVLNSLNLLASCATCLLMVTDGYGSKPTLRRLHQL